MYVYVYLLAPSVSIYITKFYNEKLLCNYNNESLSLILVLYIRQYGYINACPIFDYRGYSCLFIMNLIFNDIVFRLVQG